MLAGVIEVDNLHDLYDLCVRPFRLDALDHDIIKAVS